MAITFKQILRGVVLVGATAAITSTVVSRQQEGQAPGMEDMEKMMQAWLEAAQPGPEHAEIAACAGRWKQETTYWHAPGMPAEHSSGTADGEAILGGRFLLERVHGTMDLGGQRVPFEGIGLHGYDNVTKRYQFAWADNMGTMILTANGKADASGTVTYHGTMEAPTGETMHLKSVYRQDGADRRVYEMYNRQPDGSWFEQVEVVSTRMK